MTRVLHCTTVGVSGNRVVAPGGRCPHRIGLTILKAAQAAGSYWMDWAEKPERYGTMMCNMHKLIIQQSIYE